MNPFLKKKIPTITWFVSNNLILDNFLKNFNHFSIFSHTNIEKIVLGSFRNYYITIQNFNEI